MTESDPYAQFYNSTIGRRVDPFDQVIRAVANHSNHTRVPIGRRAEPDNRKQKPESHRMGGKLHEAAVARRRKRKRGGKK